jgi:hypothetical protein
VTIKRVLATGNGFAFSVACRNCREEFAFVVPTTPPGPFDSHCPKCQDLFDLAKGDDEPAVE